jgi:hypothetical protein
MNCDFEQVAILERAVKLGRSPYGRKSYSLFFDQEMIRDAYVMGEEIFLRDVKVMKDDRVINYPRFVDIAEANCNLRSVCHRKMKCLGLFFDRLACLVHVGVMYLHMIFRPPEICESELSIKTVRVSRCERPSTQALKIRVRDDDFHKPFAQPSALKFFQHEHVSDIGIGGPICDDSRKADLSLAVINAEGERMLD